MLRLFLSCLANRWFEYLGAAAVIALAVSALVVQGSLTDSAEKQVHDLAHHLGKNMLVVPEETDLGRFYALEYGDASLPDSYPDRLMRSPLASQIRGVRATLYGNVQVSGVALVLVGEPGLSRDLGWSSSEGAAPAALGDSAARRLGLRKGDTFWVGERELRVAEVAPSLPNGLDMAVFTDLDVVQGILGKPGEINAMHLGGCWCNTDVPALAADVERELPNTRAITVAGVIESQQGMIATVGRYSRVLFWLALFLVGGITLVLTMAQVKRQTREIGLLVAIGASTWSITLFFVAVATVIAIAGAVVGFLLGDPLTGIVADRLMGTPLPVSPAVFGPVLVPTLIASLLAALGPALKAARVDPTVTLRDV